MSPLSTLGHCFDVGVLGHVTLLSYASLDSDVNEYLIGQRWQCLRLVQCAEMSAGLYARRGVEMVHE